MRWSLRRTLLAIVLPLTVATIALSAARIADLVTIRNDIEAFRDGAFRSIYAERYARQLQSLLKVSFDHLVGRGDGLEAIASARSRIADTLERLRPFVHAGTADATTVSELTSTMLGDWKQTQEQIDIYLERAFALAQRGDAARGRRLVMDELEVLVGSRIFSRIDLIIRREQELLEENRVRIARETEHWPARFAGAIDLREELLPDVYEAILAERFALSAHADLKAFTHFVFEGRPLDASHGVAARQAIARLSQLQRDRANDGGAEGASAADGLGEAHALIRDAYARTLALPPASRGSNGLAVVERLDEVFEQSLLPTIHAIVWAHEQSIEGKMARFGHLAGGILLLTIGLALAALLLALGSPYLASRLLIRPVLDLLDTVGRFREGNKDARPRMRSRSELGLLARSLKALLDELQESERKVRDLALYDSTTGLPNRQFFQERLAGSLLTARIQERTMALLTLNLSGLKQVNETLGHGAGDDVIRQVASRLGDSVRLSDIVSHPSREEWKSEVSRLGGNQFTVLLTKISKAPDAAIAAQRVLTEVSKPYNVADREIVLTVSIGIGVYPQDGGDADTLLRNSSAALNHARNRGGNFYQFHSEAMNVANSRKLHIQSRLSGAIERNDLELHYQPIRNAAHGHLTGVEALLRWVDAELGPIGPDEFIPIAEQTGLISEIGNWVLSSACEQARAWQAAGYPELRMSVNVSASQFREADWVETVASTLRENEMSPGCLELEITETTIIQDEPKTMTALTELSEMGVGIVLDDFGTGYSSLSYLRGLPICRVKIDRSFVSEISEEGEGGALTGAIIALAHSIDLEVVAEGVEIHGQANFLRENRCDELQGYLISRAVPATEFERFMERRKPESQRPV